MSLRVRYACEWGSTGYANAGRRAFAALRAVGADVAWTPLHNTEGGRVIHPDGHDAPAELLDHLDDGDATAADATVLHCIPMSWARLVPQRPARRMVGHTVWEADTLPTRWLTEMAPVEEVWVPCAWNAEVMRRAGLHRAVHVIPHVIATVEPEPVPLDIPADHTVFLTISAWDTRKAPHLTIEAYLRAFTADDPVTLIVKSGPGVVAWGPGPPQSWATWWQVMEVLKHHRRPASVVLVTDHYSDAQIAGLVRRADAYVSLTRAEGWGLGAFDAATVGCPVIITGHGGQLDYLGADHPGLVPFEMVPVTHPDGSMFEPGMTWAEPDLAAAVELLREVVRSDRLRRHAAEHADVIRERFSPERVGALMRDALT